MRSALVLVGGAILVLSFFAHASLGWRIVGGALRIIGTAYALYGAAAFVLTGFNPHFLLLFILPGCLLAAPTFS